MTERAEVNQLLGIDSRVIGLDEIRELCPELDLSTTRRGRSWARSTTRPAGSSATTRSSGATRAAPTARGVEIHQNTEVTGISATAAASPACGRTAATSSATR